MSSKKNVYLEAMRVVAIIGVLFAHLPGYQLYITRTGLMQFIYLSMTMISRLCIPIFFMISGALLLRKTESYEVVFKKRILRFLGLIGLFETLYYLLSGVESFITTGAFGLSFNDFIHGILTNTFEGLQSYWYLYAYLGFLLLLPFMQRIAAGMDRVEFFVLLGLHFIFSTIVPLINILLVTFGIDQIVICIDMEVPLACEQAFIYTLLGYYLENKVDITKLEGKNKLKLWGLFFVTLIVSNLAVMLQGATTGSYSSYNVFITDYLYAVYAYLLIKRLYLVDKPSLSEGKSGKVVCFLGAMSFGVYLLDPFLKLFLYGYFEKYLLTSTPYIIATLLWILFSMVVGSLITLVLKKLPVFKALL